MQIITLNKKEGTALISPQSSSVLRVEVNYLLFKVPLFLFFSFIDIHCNGMLALFRRGLMIVLFPVRTKLKKKKKKGILSSVI